MFNVILRIESVKASIQGILTSIISVTNHVSEYPYMSNSNGASRPKIAVIGAGLAGLACAAELQARDFLVDIFEKSRGSGGRMSTRRGADWAVDHGAQYFTARDPLFINALSSWLDQKQVALWAPELKVFENGQWQTIQSNDKRYVATPGMSSLGKYLAQPLSVQHEQTIKQIERVGSTWVLHTNEAGQISRTYEGLVLTIPSPQALALVNGLDTEASQLAAATQMNACWTLMIKFATQPALELDAGFVNHDIISWLCRNASKPERSDRDYWVVHANPIWSQTFIELSKEEATAKIVERLTRLGFHCQGAEITTHRWRYASGFLETQPECYLSAETHLGLCGDWLHGGRVEGAWLSGYKLAHRMAVSY